jgi:hypothetical protein
MSVKPMSQPASSHFASQDAHLAQLSRALEHGWRIEPPIYLRYQWFGHNKRGYYFILKRWAEVDLLVIPDCAAIRHWVRAHRLHVLAS